MSSIVIISIALLWLTVLFNLILTLAIIRRLNMKPSTEDGLKVGTRAPNFTAQTLNGEPVTQLTYAGRSIALVFIGATCSPCREALPSYEALGPVARRAGVEVVLVSIDDAVQTGRLIEEAKITLPVIIAPRDTNPLAKDYKVHGTPSYCYIDAAGIVQSAGYPGINWGEWKALSDKWATHVAPDVSLAAGMGG